MAARVISREWVARILMAPTVVEPDSEDPALRHALGRIPERQDRVLRVVYNQSVTPWRIVTVYLDREAGRRL